MNGPRNNPVNDHDLTNTLNQRADDFARLGGHDLDLSQVVSRAGEIRRGRRMRASMMMAAVVVAVAVPVGITVIGSDSNHPHQLPITSNPPNPTADDSPITLDGLKRGDPPKYGYAKTGGTLHDDAAGTILQVGKPGSDIRAVARINGGWLAEQSDGQGGWKVTFVGDDGTPADVSWPIGDGGFAVSPEGNVGAFVEPDGTVVAVQDAGSRHFELGRLTASFSPTWGVAAVTGENCSGRSEQTGCTVYANDLGTQQSFYSITDHGKLTLLDRSITRLAAAGGGLFAGITSTSDSGSCSSVQPTDSGVDLWSTCNYRLLAFSPDGKYLLATQAYGDGLGDTELAVLDARSGKVVLDLRAAEGVTLYSLAWEDSDSVLALAGTGNRFEVIRFALDGNRTLALGPQTGADDTTPPFLIPTT